MKSRNFSSVILLFVLATFLARLLVRSADRLFPRSALNRGDRSAAQLRLYSGGLVLSLRRHHRCWDLIPVLLYVSPFLMATVNERFTAFRVCDRRSSSLPASRECQ